LEIFWKNNVSREPRIRQRLPKQIRIVPFKRFHSESRLIAKPLLERRCKMLSPRR